MMRKTIAAALGVAFIAAFTAALVEGMYRYYLSSVVAGDIARSFTPDERPTFNAFGRAPWLFDRDQGFSFERQPWGKVAIKNGLVTVCDFASRGDKFGNYLVSTTYDPDGYAKADLRLVIVGSSYSMVGDERSRLVNEVLMERLSQHLGRKVHILNFSRDGTGVLSYFDTAQLVIEESKPDAVLMLINVVALGFPRHWRLLLPDRNGFSRLYLSLDPVERPTDPRRTIPTPHVVSDKITKEWCERELGAGEAGRNDPVLRALIDRQQQLEHEVITPRVALKFWRPDVSFIWNQLRYGSPFEGMTVLEAQPVYSPHTLQRFSDDPRFREAVDNLKRTGVPVIMVHIPTLREMRNADGDWDFADGVPPMQAKSLLTDLERTMGEPVVQLYRFYPEGKRDPKSLVISEQDSHPSKLGVAVMAEALEYMLQQDPRTSRLLSATR
jgi:hypothetical protein